MPSFIQQTNGIASSISQQSNSNEKPYATREVDVSRANDSASADQDHDAFQRLPNPQQDVLLLHGPRQKYSLQTTGQIPELRAEREMLVQVCWDKQVIATC